MEKLAILNLSENSDIIESIKMIENNINIKKIIIIKVESQTSITVKHVFREKEFTTTQLENLIIDCSDTLSAIVNNNVCLLVEYSIGDITC